MVENNKNKKKQKDLFIFRENFHHYIRNFLLISNENAS